MCHISNLQNDHQYTAIICTYSLRNKDKQTSCKYIGKVLVQLALTECEVKENGME